MGASTTHAEGHDLKNIFTILVGEHYFTIAEYVNKTIDEFLVVVEVSTPSNQLRL